MKVLIVVLVALAILMLVWLLARRNAAQPPEPRRPLGPSEVAEIDRHVMAGNEIQAIKILRERTGLGLKEAKVRIDAWQPGSTPRESIGDASDAATIELPPHVRDEVTRLVAADQKIPAIKLVRQHTGLGLKDAKDVVEGWH